DQERSDFNQLAAAESCESLGNSTSCCNQLIPEEPPVTAMVVSSVESAQCLRRRRRVTFSGV
ncbi:hypothetical protein pipiens_014161, partial [Culex pipiens pipiens]